MEEEFWLSKALRTAPYALQFLALALVVHRFLAALYGPGWAHLTPLFAPPGDAAHEPERARLLSSGGSYGTPDPPGELGGAGHGIAPSGSNMSFNFPDYDTPNLLAGQCAPWGGAVVTGASAGLNHTVLVAGGEAYGFGANKAGQLGLRHDCDCDTPQCISGPWAARSVTAAAAGEDHTLLLAGGAVYATGFNRFGQLGVGDRTDRDSFQPLATPSGWSGHTPVTALAAGKDHSLVLASGEVYGCGCNTAGQLGLGHTTACDRLTRVTGPWRPGAVTAVAAGEGHSLVVADGHLYAFGGNDTGQLGLGGGGPRLTPQRLPPAEAPWGEAPVEQVAAGENHSLVVVGGRLYGFGSNFNGQLGVGPGTQWDAPRALEGPWAPHPVTRVATKAYHTLVLSGGRVYTFGNNYHCQLGLGHDRDTAEPTPIAGAAWGAATPDAVAAGKDHSVVLAGGKAYTFGYHRHGQLGLGVLDLDEGSEHLSEASADAPPPVGALAPLAWCLPRLGCPKQVRLCSLHAAVLMALVLALTLALAVLTAAECWMASPPPERAVDRALGVAVPLALLGYVWWCGRELARHPPLGRSGPVGRRAAALGIALVLLAAARCAAAIMAPWLPEGCTDYNGLAAGGARPGCAGTMEVLWHAAPVAAVLLLHDFEAPLAVPPPSPGGEDV